MSRRLMYVLRVAAVVWLLPHWLAAQTPPPSDPFTLRVNSRLVLTDVMVTDRLGNPVQGLDRSAFQVFDNGNAQLIASFAEHTSTEAAASADPAPSPGQYTNAYLQHPPPSFNVLLLDITTISITDQMFLAAQLQTFAASVSANELVAVYTRAGDRVVLLQDFTSDPHLLRAALTKAIPKLPQPGSWAVSDLDTMQQMISALKPYPGRKNLIWFSGGSNLALLTDAGSLPAPIDLRPMYDALEATRIAVYPVDARGLTTYLRPGMQWQQMMMAQTAEATGGHAYYNNNGLGQIAANILHDGSDFYTISYYPHNPKVDRHWHKVSITVKGPYQLSYRRGYFNDDPRLVGPAAGSQRSEHGKATAPVDPMKAPILFSATVVPGTVAIVSAAHASPQRPPKRNEQTYVVHFTLPVAGLTSQMRDGQLQVTLNAGAMAVNRLGTRVAQRFQSIEIGLDPVKLRSYPNGTVSFDQTINLPLGDESLYVMIWDPASGRFGIVQAPLTVTAASR